MAELQDSAGPIRRVELGAWLIRCESSCRAHLLGDVGVFGVAAFDLVARVGVAVTRRCYATAAHGWSTLHRMPMPSSRPWIVNRRHGSSALCDRLE